MNRRTFLSSIACAILAAPLAAGAQQEARRVPRVGFLQQGNPSAPTVLRVRATFNEGLREHGGYVDGQNIAIEYRLGESVEGPQNGANDLIRRNVDVIVAGGTPAGLAAQRATKKIPVVVGAMADPIADGLVASLARPGANITGVSFLAPELGPKRLQLLRDVVPGVARIAVLQHPAIYSERTMRDMLAGIRKAAVGIEVQVLDAKGPNDFDAAFSAMAKAHAGALIVFPSPMFYVNYRRLVDLAATHRLPAMYVFREAVDAGGLISYGSNIPDLFRQVAAYVAKILRGAKPADLPIEQPTQFELVINLKTAKALGLTVPQSLRLRADELIE